MTQDRIIHGIAGAAFWVGYLIMKKPDCSLAAKIGLLPIVLFGTWVSDWDLIISIKYHRSPLTHSILPFLVFKYVSQPFSRYVFPAGFALGLASHLFWDIMYYGNVRWITGGGYDRIFLFANTLILLIWIIKMNTKPDEQDSIT